MKGLDDTHDHVEMCIVCGERPARPGNELCSVCLSEHKSLANESDDGYIEDITDPAEEALHEVDDINDLDFNLDESVTPDSDMGELDDEYTEEDDELL